jgi:putative SOS response-associated peptidase YedK
MCYFVEINLPREQLEERFGIPVPQDPRYMQANFLSAFTKPYLPVITSYERNSIQMFQWGLIPSWVKDEKTADKISNATYNAKSETLWEKPSFRNAAKYKRCLVLVHGFFEWHTSPDLKIPYYIRRKDNQAFAFAGLHEDWTNPETGEIIKTFSIITTQANPLLEKIHNTKKRMPVILPPERENDWIEKDTGKENLEKLLVPFPDYEMEAYSISRKILDRNLDIQDDSILKPHDYKKTGGLFNN